MLEVGCRPIVETPAGMNHRHVSAKVAQSKRENSRRAPSPPKSVHTTVGSRQTPL
jgi:hypothetical protein